MNHRSCRIAFSCLVAASLLVSCGTYSTTAHPSGFLGDYSKFRKPQGEEEAELIYIAEGADISGYTKIIVDPVTVWVKGNEELKGVPKKDMQKLTSYLYKSVCDQLSKDYELVDQPSPDAMRLRAAITSANDSRMALRLVSTIVPVSRILSTGRRLATGTFSFVGSAGVEVEVLDSESGKRIGAAVDRRAGYRLASSTDSWGDVYQAFDHWSARLRARLAEGRANSKNESKNKSKSESKS